MNKIVVPSDPFNMGHSSIIIIITSKETKLFNKNIYILILFCYEDIICDNYLKDTIITLMKKKF